MGTWMQLTKRGVVFVFIGAVFSTLAQTSTNNAIITSGDYMGNTAGYSELSSRVIATSINGLTASGNNVISNSNGFFEGGDGDKAGFLPSLVAVGGSGLYLQNGTNTVFGGTFSGGAGFSSAYEDGYGIYQQVDAGSTADLSLYGGVIHSGLLVRAEADASAVLSISSNVTLNGSFSKAGLGELSLRGEVSSSIQQLEIEGGTVQLDSFYQLASGDVILLSDSSALLKADAGMGIAGSVVGVVGATLEVADLLNIGGSMSQINVIFTGVSNRLELVSGTNITATTFFATNGLADTLAFTEAQVTSSEALGIGQTYQSFERIELADGVSNIWELTLVDVARTNFIVDGGSGNNDMLAWKDGGTYSNAVFAGAETYNTGFELYGLSEEADTWLAAADDAVLGSLNARGGSDVLDFENYKVEAADIGGSGIYQNFEGALLSSTGSVWDATDGYAESFYIDASRTNYTLSYENATGGITANTGDMGSDDRYRNFDAVLLSGFADIWEVDTTDSTVLTYIDAGNGEDLLSGNLENATSIGATQLYRNFEQVSLRSISDVWTVTSGDDDLTWVDAQGGTDTLIGALTDSSLMGASDLYRNFERVRLNDGNSSWTITSGDEALTWIDALGTSDTDVLMGALSDSSDIGVSSLYRNFEQVELTSGGDIWTVTSGDSALTQINAGGGADTLRVNTDQQIEAQSFDAYASFETLRVLDGVVDLGTHSLTWNGTYIQEADATLSLLATTNGVVAPRLSATQIQLTPETTIRLDGESFSNYSVMNRYTNQILQASSGFILDEAVNTEAANGFDVKEWYATDEGLFAVFDRRSLSDATNGITVATGSTLDQILMEIDTLSSDEAARMVDLVFSAAVNPTAEDLNKVYGRSVALPRAMSHLRNGVFRSISDRATERRMMMGPRSVPRGARAPATSVGGSSIWVKGYTANGSASQDGVFEGYDLTGVGSMLGVDVGVGEWLFGAAGGAYSQTMNMDESGDYTGVGTHVSGFVSYGIEGWFVEGSLSAASASLDFESEGLFALEAQYAATDTSFYLGTGYMMKDERSAWIPEIGILISSYSQDEVTDTSQTSVPVELESISQTSMQMRMGLLGVFRRGFIGRELLTQVKVRWMNHMSVFEDEVDFRLSNGAATYQMPLLTPAKSLLEVGLSAQLRMNRSFSLLMGFDFESGGGYSANRLSTGLRYNF
jgi:hypothetical protein